MTAYLGTSAALRMLAAMPGEEPARLRRVTERYLDDLVANEVPIVSSVLLRAEVLCQAKRQLQISPAAVSALLGGVSLIAMDPADVDDAPNTPGRLRTLDAIHLTVALRVGATTMVAFDEQLLRASREAGMQTGP